MVANKDTDRVMGSPGGWMDEWQGRWTLQSAADPSTEEPQLSVCSAFVL